MEKINLSDAEFKTLVIRMLRGITGYSKSINEEMNVTLSEIKKKISGQSTVKGMKPRIKSMTWNTSNKNEKK